MKRAAPDTATDDAASASPPTQRPYDRHRGHNGDHRSRRPGGSGAVLVAGAGV
jgi:hypothetical protein